MIFLRRGKGGRSRGRTGECHAAEKRRADLPSGKPSAAKVPGANSGKKSREEEQRLGLAALRAGSRALKKKPKTPASNKERGATWGGAGSNLNHRAPLPTCRHYQCWHWGGASRKIRTMFGLQCASFSGGLHNFSGTKEGKATSGSTLQEGWKPTPGGKKKRGEG